MDQYLLIPFLVGWTSINPSYFDVNYRGTRFWHTAIYWECHNPNSACRASGHRAPAHRNRHVTSQQIRAMGCSPLGLTHAVWNSDVGSTAKKTDLECFGFLRCCKMYIYIYSINTYICVVVACVWSHLVEVTSKTPKCCWDSQESVNRKHVASEHHITETRKPPSAGTETVIDDLGRSISLGWAEARPETSNQ